MVGKLSAVNNRYRVIGFFRHRLTSTEDVVVYNIYIGYLERIGFLEHITFRTYHFVDFKHIQITL